jgi:adenosylhomocysteine nucleosidase
MIAEHAVASPAGQAAPTLTLACALHVEERVARRAGARAARVGLAASLPLPEGPLVSFGLAGALEPRLVPGTLVTASRVVDEDGNVVWEGDPLRVAGAQPVVVCGARHVVDGASERHALATRTGAAVVDTESGVLARTGRLAGVVRVVSDTPQARLGKLATAAKPGGEVAWLRVAEAFLTEPRRAVRTARASRLALRTLEGAALELAGGTA